MLNLCWNSQDDENLKPTYYFDEGHYPHTKSKSVINSPSLPSKPSGYYLLRDRQVNAKNGYNMNCDFIMSSWRNGTDYMIAVRWACEWLAKFNERSGVV